MLQAAGALARPRERLGAALFAAGTGLALASGPTEIFSQGRPGFGFEQQLMLGAGVALAVIGAAIDLLAGPRHLDAWRREVLPTGRHVLRLAFLMAQVSLLGWVAQRYEVESVAFYDRILMLIPVGFLAHHLLPACWRPPFFLLLSGATLFIVAGAVAAGWIVGLALGLLAICHLPIRFWGRVAVLAGAGSALAALRSGAWANPIPAVVWPLVGSLVMFRLIVYLYDREHEKAPARLSQRLGYFFLLPNVAFPVFPVVDYKAYRRTYYDAEWPDIYQRGVDWMVRGLVHLLLYRVVNTYLVIAPEEVTNAATLAQYLTANFCLYLRVSGQFHLVVGLLHLFGFHLPPTNRLYFLASSFTDFWRRINIYWKDFMMKVFYYPAYFRLTRFGPKAALVLATLWVFLITWFLHAYQWFWLRGSFLYSQTDILFWSILALLVAANALHEATYGRPRTLGRTAWTWRRLTGLAWRTSATFAAICALWSLWTSESVRDWLAVWRAGATLEGIGILLGVFLLPGIVAALLEWADAEKHGLAVAVQAIRRRADAPASLVVALVALLGLTAPGLDARLDPAAMDVVDSLRTLRLSQRDSDRLRRGYYENLEPTNDLTSPLWQTLMPRPSRIPTFWNTDAVRLTDSFLGFELVPNARITFRDRPLTINRWGMRDRDYEQRVPPATYRVALLGSSHAMGHGVADGEPFEALLEERVNRELPNGPRLEILNFAVSGYTPLQTLAVFEDRALAFVPAAAIFVAHPSDRITRSALASLWSEAERRDPWLRAMLAGAGITPATTPVEAGTRLTRQFIRHFVALSRERGIQPVWIMLPGGIGEDLPLERADAVIRLAEDNGFVVVDLMDVYEGQDPETIYVADWDRHPNQRGHQLIADRVYRLLRENPDRLLPGFATALPRRQSPLIEDASRTPGRSASARE
jgi:hypothetical protein